MIFNKINIKVLFCFFLGMHKNVMTCVTKIKNQQEELERGH